MKGFAVRVVVQVVVEHATDIHAAWTACTDTIVDAGHQWETEDGITVTIVGADIEDVTEVEVE